MKMLFFIALLECFSQVVEKSWLIGRNKSGDEAPTFWPPDVKRELIRKDPDAGKDWRQEEKGMAEDKMVGWHHRLNGHEFEQAPGDGDGQESLMCCSPWGRKESDMTERLNTNNNIISHFANKAWFCLLFTTCLKYLHTNRVGRHLSLISITHMSINFCNYR